MTTRPTKINDQVNARISLSPSKQRELTSIAWMLCAELMLIGDRSLDRMSQPLHHEYCGLSQLRDADPDRFNELTA